MRLVLGTRGSLLAQTQSEFVAAFFRERNFQVDIRVIKTSGDVLLDRPLSAMPNKGAFTKELEDALLADDIDFAVHSLKDLPTESPHGLSVMIFPSRQDCRDVLVGKMGQAVSVASLPHGARVGTSSVRRAAQLRAVRPDVCVCALRGNVDTRLRKLDDGEFDAIVLAGAGLLRLNLSNRISEFLDVSAFMPTPAQGALGVQFRSDDERIFKELSPFQTSSDVCCVRAERSFLTEFGGGCSAPLGALAKQRDNGIELKAALWDVSGAQIWRADGLSSENPEEIGLIVARKLRQNFPL